MSISRLRLSGIACAAALLAVPNTAVAQQTATIRGTVTRAVDGQPIAGVQIMIAGSGLATATNTSGKYVLQRVPAGAQTIRFRWLGYAPVERQVNVSADMDLDIAMEAKPVSLADITVSAASREPERIVEAPAAVSRIDPRVLQTTAPTGQAPLALAQSPGVDLVQNGVNDFNINARGFNSSLNRRVLTLLDGRDLAIAFLGSQEWNTLPVAMDELRSMELVRGPGSALYGANAFAGVINMTSLSPRELQGTKISVSGGELESYKVDGRYAAVFGEGRFGFRMNAGYSSNDTWTRSRTALDSLDLSREYAEAGLTIGKVPFEAVQLAGQELGAGRAATGDRDPITTAYGSGRLDYYFDNGGVLTMEGGASSARNETYVTGIGRVQILEGFKPYGRLAYDSDRFNLFGYWNRRETKQPQVSLASTANLLETSDIFHVEGQANAGFMDGQGKAIVGVSFRQYNVNTDGSLMAPADDDRSDKIYSAYGQLEYRITDQVRLVGAARYDEGDLFDGQFSPKAGIVYSPSPNHSFRATVNKAFQTPNYSEFFLRANAAAPRNFGALEGALRASALGPALAGVAQGELFSNSAAVPVLALGNAALDVEKTTGYEVGYKGTLSPRIYLTVDAYINNITNFVTDLLPGINPTYGAWTAPDAVPEPFRETLVTTVRTLLAGNPATALAAAGLTRVDGSTAVVLSYGNAGEVDQKGIDVAMGIQLNDELQFNGSVSYFDFEVVTQQAGDKLLANTPQWKGTLTLNYSGTDNGLNGSISMRMVQSYEWAAGVFAGTVPSNEMVDASLGYQFSPYLRLFAVGTNIFDQQRFQLYGGSVLGRRVLGGVTVTF
jgi:iron complex outermembrane receptor protein